MYGAAEAANAAALNLSLIQDDEQQDVLSTAAHSLFPFSRAFNASLKIAAYRAQRIDGSNRGAQRVTSNGRREPNKVRRVVALAARSCLSYAARQNTLEGYYSLLELHSTALAKAYAEV